MTARGLIIAGTSSHCGKTTITMGLARALKRDGVDVHCIKSGPDYIDPGYLAAASGRPCVNIDGWAMDESRMGSILPETGFALIESAMGLYDGAPPDGAGSAADLACRLGLPVVLVIDCAAMGQSVAAVVAGFTQAPNAPQFVGLILNKIGSERHERILRQALNGCETPILAALPRNSAIYRPSRHLGLIQASEHVDINALLEIAANHVAAHLDISALVEMGQNLPAKHPAHSLAPLGQSIAVASDAAFTFTYAHILDDWHRAGASISKFSPLADETPDPNSDAVFLPGGYPELFAQDLARAGNFRKSMAIAAASGKTIYGECGGYMVLGRAITDAKGIAYPMLGLLNLETSFTNRRLHLGYRRLTPLGGPFSTEMAGHEFHYATVLHAHGLPLFDAADAESNKLDTMGLVSGSVSGSFAHVIDRT